MAVREFEKVTFRPTPLRSKQIRLIKKAKGFPTLNATFDWLIQRTFNSMWSRLDDEARRRRLRTSNFFPQVCPTGSGERGSCAKVRPIGHSGRRRAQSTDDDGLKNVLRSIWVMKRWRPRAD